jgi:hypothetical protein
VRNLRFFQEAIALIRQPEGGTYPNLRALHEHYALQTPLAAALIKMYESDCRRKARLRAAAAVLAAERYRRATGKSPEGWSDIVPKYVASIPKDPFDATPLRWKKTATGFRIESLWIGGSVRMDPQDPEQKGNGMEFWHAEQRGKLPAVPLPDDPGKPSQVP